jgi:hypothetical protein
MTIIQLGHKVVDIVSKLEGIATTKMVFLTGNVQFGIQTLAKDGVMPDPIGIDAAQLDYIDEGIIARVTPEPDDTGIFLGEKYQDIITKAEGIAVRKNVFGNGCVYYSLAGDKDIRKDGHLTEYFFEYKRLKRLSAGVTVAIAKKMDEKPTGGPTTRMAQRG